MRERLMIVSEVTNITLRVCSDAGFVARSGWRWPQVLYPARVRFPSAIGQREVGEPDGMSGDCFRATGVCADQSCSQQPS